MATWGRAGTSLPLEDERLARVADDMQLGFFEASADGTITLASPGWCEIAGVDARSAIGSCWLETVAAADLAAVQSAWTLAVSLGRTVEQAYHIERNGETRSVRTVIAPLPAASTLSSFAGVTIDVTHLVRAGKALDDAIEQFDLIAEAMPQLMWIAAPDGTIEYFNRRWLDYTGVGVDAMHLSGVKNVVHPDDLGSTWEQWNNALVTGEPYEIEYRLRNTNTGTYRWFIGRAIPYRNAGGDVVRWIGTATDIDAQKRAYDNMRFVLDASKALAANLDVDGVCRTLADLAIQRVADWCFIVVKDQQGDYQTRAIAHRDPALVQSVEAFRDRYPVTAGSPLDRAIRRNAPMLVPAITENDLAAVAKDEQHLRILKMLRMHSAMLVPLSTEDGTVYGGITLVSSESARAYDTSDLEVAEMVAHRAAAAIHTATAFEHERRRAERLDFIAQASELLVQATDLHTMLDRLTKFVVSRMADMAYVMLAENRDSLRTVSCAHADPQKAHIAEHLRGQRTLRPDAEEKAIWVLSQHRTLLHKSVPLEPVLAGMWEYLAPDVRALEIHSAITVPLFSRGETFGALIVYWCTPDRVYTDEDAQVFTDLGRRLSIAIEHIHVLERERRIAEALQQALLPQPGMLPAAPGLRFSAHYRPSAREAHVGGDWYDAVTLPDGSIAISVGDVTGRGLRAAGLMGKLRQALGMAALYERDPARILDAVDFHLRSRRSSSLATAFIGIIDADHRSMRYASAGHPPALLRRGGELFELKSTGLPLGLRDRYREESQETSIAAADLLILYTDGLVEATRDVLFGEQRLAILAGSDAISFVRNPAEFLCDACLPPDAQDDTAVLTVSFGERPSWAFDAENAQAAHDVRSQLMAYLREHAGAGADLAGAELVFGELIGNVVRHAPGPIEVQLDWSDGRAVLHVIDRGRGFVRDPSLPADVLSESGRGLYIVSRLTEQLRVERIAGYGNHVAAALRIERGR
jgi:PAS domain S-box-containing protein